MATLKFDDYFVYICKDDDALGFVEYSELQKAQEFCKEYNAKAGVQ